MKIAVLTHLEKEDDPSHDKVVDQVIAALRNGGHKASVLGGHADVKKLIPRLARRDPNLVFNLMETFGKNELGAVPFAGLLQLLDYRYTGSGPGETFLQEDKALTKK